MSAMPLCFCFLAELVVDKAMELRFVGGVYGGNIKPTPFLCLTLKMLQIQPEKDIIVEFIKNEDFKWVKYLLANINILISWLAQGFKNKSTSLKLSILEYSFEIPSPIYYCT